MSSNTQIPSATNFTAAAERVLKRIEDHQEAVKPGAIVGRLRTKFGLGDFAVKRLKMYESIERLYTKHPHLVHQLIDQAVKAAATANQPGRYFCVVIKKLIAEAGLEDVEESKASW